MKNSYEVRRDMRRHIRHVRSVRKNEQRQVSEGARPWVLYTDALQSYITRLSNSFPEVTNLKDEATHYFRTLGKRPLIIDVCGAARAQDIDAFVIHSTMSQVGEQSESDEQNAFVFGDIVRKRVQKKMTDAIDAYDAGVASKEKIFAAFFFPGAGFIFNEDNIVTNNGLLSLFDSLYNRLMNDGSMYIDFLDSDVTREQQIEQIAQFSNYLAKSGISFDTHQFSYDPDKVTGKHTVFRITKSSLNISSSNFS